MGLIATTVVAAFVVLVPALASAQEPWPLKQGQQRLDFASKDRAIMAGGFLLFLPKGYDKGKWPLIVFLHGRGEVGTDPEQIRQRPSGLPRIAEKNSDFKFIVASPQLASTATWFDPLSLDDFLDQILARLPMIDRERIYLTGVSMGGVGAWAWAAASPQRFAAVAPMAGTFDADRACELKSVPIWAFHNDRDFVVRLEKPQKVVDAVNACGGSVKFTVFPNREAHDAWSAAYAKPELFDWLLSHKRAATR